MISREEGWQKEAPSKFVYNGKRNKKGMPDKRTAAGKEWFQKQREEELKTALRKVINKCNSWQVTIPQPKKISLQGVGFEIIYMAISEGGHITGFQFHLRGKTCLSCLFPSSRAQAPVISSFQPVKAKFGAGG